MSDPMRLPHDGSCICNDSRPCFAKTTRSKIGGGTITKCQLLTTSYKCDGECTFCKPHRDVTNGVSYPYDYNYAYSSRKKRGAAC